jgi:hypothetical protein
MERVKALDQDEVRSTPHIERFYQAVCETRPTRPSLGVGDRKFGCPLSIENSYLKWTCLAQLRSVSNIFKCVTITTEY